MGFFSSKTDTTDKSKSIGPEIEAVLNGHSLESILDYIARRVGHDPHMPGWTDSLRQLHRHSRDIALQVIPDFFYTSVFAPDKLTAAVWDGSFFDCVPMTQERGLEFLRKHLRFLDELKNFPLDKPENDPTKYYWANPQFSHVDAATYYSLIRSLKPKLVIEIGAGFSTMLATAAIDKNAVGEMLCIDPYPPAFLERLMPHPEIRREMVQNTPISVFESLEAGDILFIDGSHIVKTGSDVNHVFLRILPHIPEGVYVQIHDIALPFEYPKSWSDQMLYWNEQYLLAALLSNSTKWEPLLSVYFHQKADMNPLWAFIPSLPGIFPGGGSFWMRSLHGPQLA